jgi:SAM-dependent methyltransferase
MLSGLLDLEMRGRARALCEALRPHLDPTATVLDVGAGTGHNGQALVEAGACARLIATDVVDLRVVGPPVTIFDGVRLPFDDASVDVCLLVHVLHYAPDPVGLLRECARVARGAVLVVQSTHDGPWAEAALRLNELAWGPVAWGVARAAGWVRPGSFALSARRCFSAEALRCAFEEAGLATHTSVERRWRVPGVRSDLWRLQPRAGAERGQGAQPRDAPRVSIIIPARNEEHLLAGTLSAALAPAARLGPAQAEVLVVDNDSTDRTREVAAGHGACVRVLSSNRRGAACARNDGARAARGHVLVFVDADTLVPPDALERVAEHCERHGAGAGITALGDRDGGRWAAAWWATWNAVRRLPMARAKAMPAFMFCTRDVFDRFGPFDEAVEIGEEWPILAGLYRAHPGRLRYDRSIVCKTSSRRMDLQRLGYVRVFGRYVWAVLHRSGRTGYGDHVRHRSVAQP